MNVRKAVITAAGWGTRFLPATKALPKETIPLVDKPVIQYVVEEAVASGIEQVIIVTAIGKRAIEDHFDRAFELEHTLEQKGDTQLLEQVRRISELAKVYYVRQKEQLGLGHAVLVAAELVGDEPFAVMLPDDVIDGETPCLKQMLDVYERYNSSVIAVQRVQPEETKSYGIIEPRQVDGRTYQILDMVEKPRPGEAPSNLAIVGRYVLTPDIFKMLRQTKRGSGGEIQLTDGLRLLLEHQKIYGHEFTGTRYDTGNPLGFLRASVELALKRPDIGPEFLRYLQGLDLGALLAGSKASS